MTFKIDLLGHFLEVSCQKIGDWNTQQFQRYDIQKNDLVPAMLRPTSKVLKVFILCYR